MGRYSRKYKVSGKLFRYDYDRCVLEYISKATADMIEDNKEWQDRYGRDLWDVSDGVCVIDGIGLSPDNWKESPKYWCEAYAEDLNIEAMSWGGY